MAVRRASAASMPACSAERLGARIRGRGRAERFLRAERFRLLRGAARLLRQFLRAGEPSVKLRLHLLRLPLDLRRAALERVHLALQPIGAALRIFHLAREPLERLLVVRDACAQHGDLRFLLRGLTLERAHLAAQPLGPHVARAHLLGAVLRRGIDRVERILRPVLVRLRRLKVRAQLQRAGLERLQVLEPDGNLQHAQLVAQDEVFLRRLRLSAQRLDLQLQLGDLVVDAHEVFLRALELALGFLLAVAVFADARRLLKDLAALAALDGQDLVDLALSDDGIALAAHARVHEELVDVLETHRLAVDIVLRLARAVVPPRHGDLRLVAGGKNVLGVVDHERHLRKAHLAALLRAAEDHVLHLRAAELAAVLLAHDPADGVGDVRLAGAIRPDDGRDILAEVENGLVRKGFEPLNFQCLQVHALHLIPYDN